MHIVFTHGYFLYEDEKEQKVMKPYPPLGLQYISSYLEHNGFPNAIFDTTFSSFEALQKYLEKEPPSLLGIYTNLMTKLNVLHIIRMAKESPILKHIRIVLGGPEVRHHREDFLRYGADIIVFGEGEATMLELARHFEAGGAMELGHIQGVAYLDEEGNVADTGDRPFLPDLDSLPLPGREKIPLQQYFDAWRRRHGYSMISISTMRGCPYSCKWCSRAVYGKSYRRRSPAKVVEEIAWLKEHYDFDRIWFVDDVFTINHGWLREFACQIQEKGLATPYEAISRADRMNEEVIQLLRDSGCFRIWIGAESGSQRILDAMNRMVKVEKAGEMIQLARLYGIEAGSFIMLGYPGETEADIRTTLRFLKRSRPDHFTLTIAYPIKGTPMYEEVESSFLKNLPWERSTSRDIDFKRPYSRTYYHHAMNWIQREMASLEQRRDGRLIGAIRYKWAAARSWVGMEVEKRRGLRP